MRLKNHIDKNNFAFRRADSDSFAQPIMQAIAIGLNAPSPHNTQSWKFKIIDDNSMFLYIDLAHLLTKTDPFCRQIHIGAGCFIETLSIGCTALGYTATTVYFPDGYQFVGDFGQKPVALITLSRSQQQPDDLAQYITHRQTNRKKYKGPLITDDEFEKLRNFTNGGHSKAVFINKGLGPYFDLLKSAFEIESRTYRTSEETRKLFRFSEKERSLERDGLSIPQMGFSGISRYFAEKALKAGDEQIWHSEKIVKQLLKSAFSGIESSRGLVFWITDTNTYENWVKVGRDFARFSLALAKYKLYCHPYTQVTQEYSEMTGVQIQLGKMLNIENSQKIQMIVRIGRSSAQYQSYRRHIDSFLIP
ncbi:MAG: hypothetical protein K0R59_90 [Sphingobacterium sp.]|jgi:hypothetical protein|nr:hypothetical protein [Sphingobacterium sp.]